MSNIHLSDGIIPAGKFIAGIGNLNIQLVTTNSKKRSFVEQQDGEDELSSSRNKKPRVVFTAEAIEALRMSQAGFIAHLGSEINNSFLEESDEVLKKKCENKSMARSGDERIRVVSQKVVESSLAKIGMIQNLNRCKDNLQYWKLKEKKDQIEHACGENNRPDEILSQNTCIDRPSGSPGLSTTGVNEISVEKNNLSAKKRRARMNRKKKKNAFKKGMLTDDLLAEQERLFAISMEKATKNSNP